MLATTPTVDTGELDSRQDLLTTSWEFWDLLGSPAGIGVGDSGKEIEDFAVIFLPSLLLLALVFFRASSFLSAAGDASWS